MNFRKNPQPSGFLSNPITIIKKKHPVGEDLAKKLLQKGKKKPHQNTKITRGCLYNEDTYLEVRRHMETKQRVYDNF